MSTLWSLRVGTRTSNFTAPVAALLAVVTLGFALHDHGAGAAERRVLPLDGRGVLVGVVQDAHGDPLPGARVRLVGELGETLLEATTSNSSEGALGLGEFRIDQLPAGHYTLVATLADSTSPAIRVPVSNWEDTRVRLHVDMNY